MKKILIVFFSVAVACVNLTTAQEYLVNMPGKWDYSFYTEDIGGYRSELNYSLNKTELEKFKQKINNVAESFHQYPVLKNPTGFTATVQGSVWAEVFDINYDASKLVNARAQAEIIIQFCPLIRDETGKVIKGCIEVANSVIMMNNPRRTTRRYLNFSIDGYDKEITAAAKKLNEIFIKPPVIKELADGVTAYWDGTIVIAKTSRPYWIPVTVGELFDLQIKYFTLEAKKVGDNSVLEMIKQEKAMFSNQELMQPAYHESENLSQITAEENESPYMRFNPDYFEDSLPRTAVQLITISIPRMNDDEDCSAITNIDSEKLCEYTKQLDGFKLKALLD